jgi:Golgi apyrase
MGKWRYGVILDAGSSGTRVHIYRWLNASIAREGASAKVLHSLPILETREKWTKKTHPGVSTFGESPGLVGPDHLQPLLDHALQYIPNDAIEDTPLFLLGTAGMRLLPEVQRTALLNQICSYTRSNTKFLLPDCDLHVQVIPGETEGLYGWIAANYLLGGFDSPEEHAHGKGHHTYGFLDMGGASAQIAFAPNATEAIRHANDLKLLRLRTVDGIEAEYRVFVTTWLGFGVNEARKRYVDALVAAVADPSTVEMPDPCLPAGLRMAINGTVFSDSDTALVDRPHLLGTGRFDECVRQAYPLLEKDVPCLDEPCLLNGVHVPAIDFDVNHFIGISEYWHTTHEIFEMGHKDKAYDFNTYQTRVKDFCSQDWTAIQAGVADNTWGKKVDEQTAYEVCFKASWLINVLHNGIGIPRVGIENTDNKGLNGTKDILQIGKEKGFLDPFQAVNTIKSTEVSWTLGKMVLYAASQVPPTEDTLPVGFGSNVAGIPADFQYPGGSTLTPISGIGQHEDDSSFADQIHDTLFNADTPRRIPGFLLFMFIISLVLFFLCGRDRRSRIYRKVFGATGRKNGFFGSKLPVWFRTDSTAHERELEEGSGLINPNEFELNDIDSDDADEEPVGRWSGSGTPRNKSALGMLSPDVMDRRGMVVRTESRERLDLSNGRKSRTVSPTRMKGNKSLL